MVQVVLKLGHSLDKLCVGFVRHFLLALEFVQLLDCLEGLVFHGGDLFLALFDRN